MTKQNAKSNEVANIEALSFDGMIEKKRNEITVQPRTLSLFSLHKNEVPKVFYFEPATALRHDKEDLKANDKNVYHQIDEGRKSPSTAMLPSIGLAKETGNAYFKDVDAAENVSTDLVDTQPKYRVSIAMCHAVYATLKRQRKPIAFDELCEKAAKAYRLADETQRKLFNRITKDCVRDLRLFGLAMASQAKINKKTLVQLNADLIK